MEPIYMIEKSESATRALNELLADTLQGIPDDHPEAKVAWVGMVTNLFDVAYTHGYTHCKSENKEKL